MKIETDKYGRRLYKFSHSVAQGGSVYVHKTVSGRTIENKQMLRQVLVDIASKYDIIDSTIKIYDTIFFFFFHLSPSIAPLRLIESVAEGISPFSQWDEDYVFTGVDDLQENFLRKDLEKWGFDYDKG